MMGEVRCKAEISNPIQKALAARKFITDKEAPSLTVDFLVDTGAVMVLLPQDVIDKLEVPIHGTAVVTLATDESIEMPVAGPITLSIGDRQTSVDCLVAKPLTEPLLGQVVLETLDLIVDCRDQTLHPRPNSPAYPSYKMK